MSLLKFGHAVVVNKVVCPGKWVDTVVPRGRVKIAKEVITKFDPSKWLLSHVTIMASVDVEKRSKDPKKNYLIKPEYSIFVNNNGDCWERDLLKAASKTFIGADNFLEHVQIKELSKGKVIDVALREVPFDKDIYGNDLTTMYVDILIATNRKHTDLIEKIQNGEYSAVSMGCVISYSICSQCGKIAKDETEACKHVRYFKNNYFYDEDGVKRIVAELCGSADDPNSCKFVDASWVRKPAFEGAVLNKVIPLNENISEKIQKAVHMPSFDYEPGLYLKAANFKNAQEGVEEETPKAEGEGAPRDDIDFPEAPEESEKALEVDKPPVGEGTEGEIGEAPLSMGKPNIDNKKEEEIVELKEPEEDATVSEIKKLLKRNVLNEIRRELLKEQVKELGKEEEERPIEIDTYTNDNLVKKANLNKILSFARPYNKLYNGIVLLSKLKNISEFVKEGYNRGDLLGILYFIDNIISDDPVKEDIVKALSIVKENDNKSLIMKIIVEIGRKPSVEECKKIIFWNTLLSKVQ